ncbi:MAG: aminomethyl-transferring glycine dehydrogenase subunit GcvPB [Thermaerobacterales bacterium]
MSETLSTAPSPDGRQPEPSIFQKSRPGRIAFEFPASDVGHRRSEELLPAEMIRSTPAALPEVSQLELVRHFTRLSHRNHGIDLDFYPLGSCTMKYNPKINEDAAGLPGFNMLHPYTPVDLAQGALQIVHEMEAILCEIGGMDRVTFQPAAGAHGEFLGLMLIRAYHEDRGDQRDEVIIPDSAHGTNPATASMVGYKVVTVASDERGGVDIEGLKRAVNERTAGLMLTNPNTLGLFDENIDQIARIIHDAGGLLYYDGANANAIMGLSRPGDMGFDVVHFNLHKTFSTPHGGGGPGSGPVGVKKELEPFLPVPLVEYRDGRYDWVEDRPKSVGRIRSFYGNFGMVVRAYAYARALGPAGLRQVSEDAVLHANYLMSRLKDHYDLPFDRFCKHEFVISGSRQKREHGVRVLDIAKRLLDHGMHPPTVYFPLIVEEALMIEPTETENLETLDRFADAMIEIAREAAETPELIKGAPHLTPVGRLDEALAARRPNLRWRQPTG